MTKLTQWQARIIEHAMKPGAVIKLLPSHRIGKSQCGAGKRSSYPGPVLEALKKPTS
jgi:hypothetical protein